MSDLKLKLSAMQGDRVIELVCHDPDRFQELRGIGLINEQISYKQRFLVSPTKLKASQFSRNYYPVSHLVREFRGVGTLAPRGPLRPLASARNAACHFWLWIRVAGDFSVRFGKLAAAYE